MSGPTIGISLGTTNSCVAVYRDGRAEIIPNAEGNRITPSYVAFTDTERLIGDAAKSQAARNPTNTIFDTKRLIGLAYNDPSVQRDMKNWPFKTINVNDKPKIEVQYKKQVQTLYPEEVSAMVLGKMKETAEAYLNMNVRNAVVTVPAYFSDSQRQATRDAGTIAGFHQLRIMNEPSASAFAYCLGIDTFERNILIYHLGGGTFDVSILVNHPKVLEVRSTAGDTHLGGEDFDNNIVKHFIEEIFRKYNRDISNDLKAITRLRTACETAKRSLSSSSEADIIIDSLFYGIDFHSKLTRDQFEMLNGDLIRSTLDMVGMALRDAGISMYCIDDVVLVGGSTRIPMVQRLLRQFFSGKELKRSVNPDEAAAIGAAILAPVLEDRNPKYLINDVIPRSIGLNTDCEVTSRIIKRNTTIPNSFETKFWTTSNNQSSIEAKVYEGDQLQSAENKFLGQFSINNIPRMPQGQAEIKVIFNIDIDGILHVTAAVGVNTNHNELTITSEGRLSKFRVLNLLEEAEKFNKEDKRQKQMALAKNNLENFLVDVKVKAENDRDLNFSVRQRILDICRETRVLIESDAQIDYAQKQRDLNSLIVPLWTAENTNYGFRRC